MCEQRGCARAAYKVHHQTYKRLGHEQLSDVEALCVVCYKWKYPNEEITPGWNRKGPGRGPIDARDFNCKFCPSQKADLFIDDYRLFFFCRGCGEPEVRVRAWKRKKMEKGKKAKQDDRMCPHCGKKLNNAYGVKQHIRDVHQ